MFDTHDPPNSAQTDHEELADDRQNLDYIVSELTRYRPDITRTGLKEAVTEWLLAARDMPAGSTREHVTDRLAEIKSRYPMYREPGLESVEDAYPEDCEDCTHRQRGHSCPVLTHNDQIRRRERIMETTSEPSRLRRRLRDLAIDNGCVVLQDTLQELKQDYEPLLKRGQLLLAIVEDMTLYQEESEAVRRSLAAEELGVSPDDVDLDALRGDPNKPPLDPDEVEEFRVEAVEAADAEYSETDSETPAEGTVEGDD